MGASPPDVDHAAGGLEEARFANVMAGFLLVDSSANEGSEIVVSPTTAHDCVEVVVELREEAGADLAVGGEADAAALSAEGL